jgi:hypothetical protein
MIETRAVMRSLPLVASVLGRKYGVKVEIGGTDAYVNGTVIRLPSLPGDFPDTLLALPNSTSYRHSGARKRGLPGSHLYLKSNVHYFRYVFVEPYDRILPDYGRLIPEFWIGGTIHTCNGLSFF